MKTNEYIKNLSYHLRKLPAREREDAISYYREYIEDAGIETEEEAIAIFGPAHQLAAGIKADMAMRNFEEEKPKMKKGISAVWLAILGVFAIPVGVPIAVAAFVIIIAILIVILAVIISFFAVAISLFAGGAASVILGFAVIFASPMTTLFAVGAGLALMAIGYFVWIFMVWISKICLKGIATLFNKIRYRKENNNSKKQAATGNYYSNEGFGSDSGYEQNNGFDSNQNGQQNFQQNNDQYNSQFNTNEAPPMYDKSFSEIVDSGKYSEPIMDGTGNFDNYNNNETVDKEVVLTTDPFGINDDTESGIGPDETNPEQKGVE